MKTTARHYFIAIGAASILSSCTCTGARVSSDASTSPGSCIDISITSLPIDSEAVYEFIEAETGYLPSDIVIERICKYGNEYLFGFYPIEREKQFQRSILLSIGSDGSIHGVPSM